MGEKVNTSKRFRYATGEWILSCGCGRPVTGRGFIVTITEGQHAGEKMWVHQTCIEPADDE